MERLCDHGIRVIGTAWYQDVIQAAGLDGKSVRVDQAGQLDITFKERLEKILEH